MRFGTDHTECHRYADCWAVSCIQESGRHKGEMAPPNWFYSTIRGAAAKMVELEMAYADADEVIELKEVENRIVSIYERMRDELVKLSAEIDGKRG